MPTGFADLATLPFLAALACAGVLGFALQRGGTCTVAAIDELVRERTATRLLALVEASLWVAGGLLVAHELHLLPAVPPAFAVSAATVAGGALIGYGAFVNGACVLGSVGRIGSGEWAYLATPAGFFAGCVGAGSLFAATAPMRRDDAAPLLAAALAGALAFAAFASWRLVPPLRAWRRAGGFAPRLWSPHAATTVIGIAFALLVVLVGPWAYTDVLAEAARGASGGFVGRAALLLALIGGAVLGGVTSGLRRRDGARAGQALRCFVGGALMGGGSLLVPGGNDSLVLVGMPLGRPHAWLAFAAMVVAIAAAMAVHAGVGRLRR